MEAYQELKKDEIIRRDDIICIKDEHNLWGLYVFKEISKKPILKKNILIMHQIILKI